MGIVDPSSVIVNAGSLCFFSDDFSMLFMLLRFLTFVYIFFVLMYAVCLVVVATCMDVSMFEY